MGEGLRISLPLLTLWREGRGRFTLNLHEVLFILEFGKVILHCRWPDLSNWREHRRLLAKKPLALASNIGMDRSLVH